MPFDRHSTIAHAAYADLLRMLKDQAVSEMRGTPTLEKRGNGMYWYDVFRVGSDVVKRYIGEDTTELRQRMERLKSLKQDAGERRKHRSRLIRNLRAEGATSMDAGSASLLSAMANAGVFRLGGTLVGTIAFRLYELELGVRLSFEQMAQTNDVDIASFEQLSVVIEDTANPKLSQVLSDFSFEPVPALDRGSVWKWRQTRSDLLVEFLTPSFSEDEGLRRLEALEVDAQSLHFLNYLISEPIAAAIPYRSGVLVQIPRPERFAIHKLIVSQRRKAGPDAIKSVKDRMQAAFLIEVLSQDRPYELAEAYETAVSNGPRWRKHISGALKRMPESAKILNSL